MLCQIAALVVIQIVVATIFLAISLSQYKIPLVVLAYTVLESILAFTMLISILRDAVAANDIDSRLARKCVAISTALRMKEKTDEGDLEQIRMYTALSDYLSVNRVVRIELFGFTVTQEKAAKLIGALVAATLSAAVRSGIAE